MAFKYSEAEGDITHIYSQDKGLLRPLHVFYASPIRIFGSITEQRENISVLTILGMKANPNAPIDWTIVTVDLTSLYKRNCTAEDYNNWSPASLWQGKCNFDIQDSDIVFGSIKDHEPEPDSPDQTKGYRLLAGEWCEGGLAEPELRACTIDLAQPGTFMQFRVKVATANRTASSHMPIPALTVTQNRAWQRGRRGGWEVYGGLFGGHPDPPKAIPIFADPELNESSDTDTLSKNEDHAEFLSEVEDHAEMSELLESKPKYLKFNCSARLPTILVENKMVGNSNDVNMMQIVKCECDNNCNLAASKFDSLDNIKRKFEGETMTIRKNKLLDHLRTQRDIIGECEIDGFYYGGHCYCVSAFSNLSCISVYLLKQIKEAHLQGLDKFEHANSFMLKVSPNKENAICWFKAFCEIYGRRAPDEVLIILPSWLNVTTIYEMYKCENVIESERISFSTFCLMVKSEFGPKNKDRSTPRVRFSKHSSHSVCSICSDLNSFQRTCRSQDEINLCRALKMKHKERYATQRRCNSDLQQTFTNSRLKLLLE